ncbi:formate-dependent phosphoribosylglycinamide formyltransferase [Pseudonocardia sp. NPDC049635]|uniref:formate-dependent phosphoribosylglycinamide formyltransferase n=1 Tax=Pseudonocardia sp. NPDC049635 TaxID=3155506 RepID=UPI0033FC2F01
MRIGTPLGPAATRVLLLGSGELGKEVAIAFQRLGVEVVAVDRYPHAPAHQVAHRWHAIDMTDPVTLATLIEQEAPDLIIPEIEAIATNALVEIEAAGTTVVPTARAAKLTMDREGIRRLAAEELGLPTSPYAFADTLDEVRAAIERVGLPCVLKPVMSSSGKGQSVLKDAGEAESAWEHARSAGRVSNPRVIVEGFVEFDYEITLLTVRHAGGTAFCEPVGHRQEDGDYVESWQPQPMSPAALAAAQDVAGRVTEALGGRGIFGVELFVREGRDGGEHTVLFSEVSPRPHDTGLVTLATQRLSEFELHARAVLGLPVDTTLRSPGASAVVYGGQEMTAPDYEGVAEALAVPGADLRLFGKPTAGERRRMGVAVAFADDVDTARDRARTAAAHVRPVPHR